MRILAIRGKNLASLEKFEVELTKTPLDRAGLFAITGPTGSGKSTLLDAMCLALFDTMPRLPEGQGVPIGRADEPEARRLKSTDVRSILRRGSGAAYAEVDFMGGDRRRYRARWEMRLARQRPDGNPQPQELSLLDLETNQLLSQKKSEVRELIEQRLGLNFAQFRRAVLLPQGDFAAFLKADGKLRAELLERITGTAIYSELSKAAHRRAGDEKKRLEQWEQQLGANQPLDEPERQALERQCAEQQRRCQELEQAARAAQRAVDWRRRLVELETLEQDAVLQVEQTRQAIQAAAPRRQEWRATQQAQSLRPLVDEYDRTWQEQAAARQALERAETAQKAAGAMLARAREEWQSKEALLRQADDALEVARPLLQQARILDEQLRVAQREQVRLRQESLDAAERVRQREQRLSRLEEERQGWRQQLERCRTWFEQHAALEPLARQWERWDSELQRYAAAAGEADGARRRLDSLARQLTAEDAKLTQASTQARALEQQIAETQNQLQTLEATTQAGSLEALAAERGRLDQRRERLRELQTLAQTAAARRIELEQAKTGLQQAREQARQSGREAAARAEEQARRQAALDEAEHALRRALLTQNESAESLRAALREGEPCPVCGAAVHPWTRDAAPLRRWVQAQQQRVDELKRPMQELIGAVSRLRTAYELARRAAVDLEAQAQRLETELAALRQRWTERSAADFSAEWLDSNLLDDITAQLAAVDQRLAQVKTVEQQALERQRRIEALRNRLDGYRRQGDRLREAREALQRSSQQIRTEQERQRTVAEQAAGTLRRLEQQLADPLAGLADWREALAADPIQFHQRCERRVLGWRKLQADGEALEKRLQESAPAVKEAEVEIRAARETARDKAAAAQEQQRRLGALQQQRGELLAGRPADAVEDELRQAAKRASEALEETGKRLDALRSQHAAACNSVELNQQENARRQAALTDAQRRLEAALAEQGLELTLLRQRLQRDAAWLEMERAALERLQADYERRRERWRERQENRLKHQADDPPAATSLAEVEAQLLQAQTDSETARRAWADLDSRLRQDRERRRQSAALQQGYAAQRRQWELWESMRQLIGSHDGSLFRGYAQSLTLDVLLAYANRHLEDLARRYRLERAPGSDLELQVIDREMGDEVRSVHSLSGGESFLASLALALGLASLSSNSTQVESLFIDEGFGSLDSDTLDIALAGLDALQSLGRQVGVISHVPAMVERIGVQVRVEARGGGRSIVRVLDAGERP